MNQETKTPTKTAYTVTVDTDNLIAATALLEQINKAARAGGLSWRDKNITIALTFLTDVPETGIAPLEAVIEAQDNILGTCCWIAREPYDFS